MSNDTGMTDDQLARAIKQNGESPAVGLTKRESMASEIAAGLCAGIYDYSPSTILDMDRISEDAISMTDSLLRKLATS